MVVGQDLVRFLTSDEIDDIVGTEILLDSEDGIENCHQLFTGLNLRLGMQTVVTVAAIVLGIHLSKVMEQHLTTTDARLCIGGSLHKQLASDILFCHRLTLHKLIEFLQILIRIESDTQSLATIATCTTSLLIIAFQRLGDIIMDHETDIGFVNTHTKGNSRYDHIDVLHQEIILRLRSGGGIQSCMIGSGFDFIGFQDSRQFFHLLPRQAIDNAALARMLLNELDNILIHLLGLGTHLIIKVRTVE